MRHTFISWDCAFRNFYHLIDTLAGQDYDLQQVELIYVEQRTRELADTYNHTQGLKALSDRKQEFPDTFFRPVYMNDPASEPYHLGRTLNHGLRLAKGEIITIMDGDLLLPPDFLQELDKLHDSRSAVVNVERKMCPHPVGADMEDWKNGRYDYDDCLSICKNPGVVPNYVTNKGPMISARRDAFTKTAGYDEHPLFSTGLTRAGQDMNARLEIATGGKSVVINKVAVHPFHPAGFSRKTLDSVRVLQLHAALIEWTRRHGIADWRSRKDQVDSVYRKNFKLLDRIHKGNYKGVAWAPVLQSKLAGRLFSFLYYKIKPFRP